MANKKIFASTATSRIPETNTCNHAGGHAYALNDEAALAQMVVTGVFNDTFYADAKSQVAAMQGLVAKASPEFLAKLAVYARQSAFMKDTPAFLVATLAARDVSKLEAVFDRVVDNGKMLRNFIQVLRSGVTGRKSLGSRPKKLVAAWLNKATDAQLLAASVGNDPSLSDVIRLSHPKAESQTREAFFGYVTGRPVEAGALPQIVRDLEAFRAGSMADVPDVPFELLTTLSLSKAHWMQIAQNMSWTQTRMNLNTLLRHGVFESKEMVAMAAARLEDEKLIARSRVFPYQLLAAYLNVSDEMPARIKNALQVAMGKALDNVPTFDGGVDVLVDTSGSMKNSVTGRRDGATSKIRCVDVAAVFASAVLRKNPEALVVPFDTRVHEASLNAFDSVMTNAEKLARHGGGGTRCAIAMAELNRRQSKSELVVYVSDNESWVGSQSGRGTETMAEWLKYKKRVPRAKLVCIDITPNGTTQAVGHDVLNVGGFSDEVFKVVSLFAQGKLGREHWVGEINKVELHCDAAEVKAA